MFNKDLLIENFTKLGLDSSEGNFIALEMLSPDYLLSKIVHLVEQNNARVLLAFPYVEVESGRHIVLLKVDLEDISPLLRSFERFDYQVKYYSQKQGLTDEKMRSRLDELMYYLEM